MQRMLWMSRQRGSHQFSAVAPIVWQQVEEGARHLVSMASVDAFARRARSTSSRTSARGGGRAGHLAEGRPARKLCRLCAYPHRPGRSGHDGRVSRGCGGPAPRLAGVGAHERLEWVARLLNDTLRRTGVNAVQLVRSAGPVLGESGLSEEAGLAVGRRSIDVAATALLAEPGELLATVYRLGRRLEQAYLIQRPASADPVPDSAQTRAAGEWAASENGSRGRVLDRLARAAGEWTAAEALYRADAAGSARRSLMPRWLAARQGLIDAWEAYVHLPEVNDSFAVAEAVSGVPVQVRQLNRLLNGQPRPVTATRPRL